MDRTSVNDAGGAAEDGAGRAGEESEVGSAVGDGDDDPAAGYQPLWVRLACIGLDFLTQTYDQIRIVPEIALFEQYVCRAYYAGDGEHSFPNGRIPHSMCKNPDVQYQLARLRSYKALFDGIASMDREKIWVGPGRRLLTIFRSPCYRYSHGCPS